MQTSSLRVLFNTDIILTCGLLKKFTKAKSLAYDLRIIEPKAMHEVWGGRVERWNITAALVLGLITHQKMFKFVSSNIFLEYILIDVPSSTEQLHHIEMIGFFCPCCLLSLFLYIKICMLNLVIFRSKNLLTW